MALMHFSMEEIAGDTEALAQIRRADEEGVHAIDRGNLRTLFDGGQRFNLNQREGFRVGLLRVFRSGHGEAGIDAADVHCLAANLAHFTNSSA